MWFLSPQYVTNIFFSALVAYLSMIVILRLSGKRSLAKWNMFDFIITIALGTTLSTAVMSTGDNNELRKGMFGFIFLMLFQYIMTWLSVRFDWVSRLLKAKPTLVVYNGSWLEKPMREQRLTKSEVLAAMRGSGLPNLKDIGAVVLETNGTLSVLGKWETDTVDSLTNVVGYEDIMDSDEEST